jgi:rfaE bifunctional protein nucleotidyltransferase chain/domain
MDPKEKIFDRSFLRERLNTLPRPLVMTNGVFDVLHRGHVDYLSRAAQLGASLLVAVNTDTSVRLLDKGPGRPLNRHYDRAFVLAGLEAVNAVTFFTAETPVDLVSAVRPDVYTKGGDYDLDALVEASLVRSWGGTAVAIPFVDGYSTTRLVDKIRGPIRQKAAFIDRDGVINRDVGYLHHREQFEFLPGVIDGLSLLRQAGYVIVVVTNQSGIARGYYSHDQYVEVTNWMEAELLRAGVRIDGIYHCPHHPDGVVEALAVHCDCRKPAPGMIERAAEDLNISLETSFFIGDQETDVMAARAANVGQAFIVGQPSLQFSRATPDKIYAGLLDCALDLCGG